MDFITYIVQDSPGALPKKLFVTLNGTAEELAQLGMAIEQARHGGPQVIEVTSATGAGIRLIVDRLGPMVPAN